MAAIITVSGGIIIALINVLSNRATPQPPAATAFPTWTNVPTATIVDTPVPTDAVPVGEPTSTPAPPTDTPAPTFTPTPYPIGADWVNDCISALWQVVPSSVEVQQENGCLKQPVGDYTIANQRFSFLVNRRFDGVQVNGMFAPLNAEGTVSLKVDLEILDKGDVWMGVFAEPSVDSQGVIMYIPPGDVTKRLLVMQPLPGNDRSQTQQFNQANGVYDVKFTYTLGTVAVTAMNNGVVFNAVPVPSAQKWLFIGYRSGNGSNNIGASFFDLALE